MQVNAEYDKYKEDYQDLSDFFAGERQVKKQETRYTPMLEGQKGKDAAVYERYVGFGILFNALFRTRQGLKGAILRKPAEVVYPESKKTVLADIMINGASFDDLIRESCDNVLGYGRYGALIDIDDTDQKPFVAPYTASSILDWPINKSKKVKQEILLQESISVDDPANPGQTKVIEQRRLLELDGEGKYLVTIYRKVDIAGKDGDDWAVVADMPGEPNPRMPKYKGKRLDFIPFVFFGSSSNVPQASRPPLLDLLNLSKGHWKLTVAYQYGLHFAGLPTPWFAGFDIEEGSKMPLGPGAAYHTTEPTATCGFLQTGGEGLATMEKGLDRIEKQMAVTGSRMLEESRPGVEAAETVKLRSSGDSATLADIAGNNEAALTDVLQYIGFWEGVSPDQCSVGLNKDFVSAKLSPEYITALVAAIQAGEMSEVTFLWNLQQGEMMQPGRSIEEEQEAIGEDKIKRQKEILKFGEQGGEE